MNAAVGKSGPGADEPLAASAPPVAARVNALDGLRGCLALIVALAHACETLYPAISGHGRNHFVFDRLLQKSPFALFLSADLAVRIFFVHSGFVLSLKYFRSRDARWPTVMFIRRPWRLGLPVFASTMLALALSKLMPFDAHALRHAGARVVAGLGETHPTIALALRDGLWRTVTTGYSHLPGAWWTMPIELYCSLGLLAVLVLWNHMVAPVRIAVIAVYFALLALSIVHNPLAPPLVSSNAATEARLVFLLSFTFVLGAGLSFAWADHHAAWTEFVSRNRGFVAVIFGGGLLVGVFPSSLKTVFGGNTSAVEVAFMGSAAIIVAGVLSWGALQRFFERPLIAWLGRISFSLYLIHLSVQRTFMDRTFIWLRARGLPYNASAVLALIVMFACALALAHLLTITADRAAINAGKGWLYRRFRLTARATGLSGVT